MIKIIGIFSIEAVTATAPPKNSEPVSPINTLAGCALKNKKARHPPLTAAIKMPMTEFICTAHTTKNRLTIRVTVEARPSMPSVKFTLFTTESCTKTVSGIIHRPMSGICARPGIISSPLM